MSVLGKRSSVNDSIGKKSINSNMGNSEDFQSQGAPPPYSLRWFSSNTFLGVPLFHFMSNWYEWNGKFNFTKKGGFGPAKVGDRVEAWCNTYLGPGEGTAFVAKDYNGENWFGDQGYPTLVEKEYGGKKFKGLRFTGTEYLQIDGATVSDTYGLPAPMFSTGGSPWAGNTGATFIFVIDQEVVGGTADTMCDGTVGGICASPVQALFSSRQPVLVPSSGSIPPIPTNYTWPSTEDFGVQYLRNSIHSHTSINNTKQKWGPDGVLTLPPTSTFGTSVDRPPFSGHGGANYIPLPAFPSGWWDFGPGVNFINAWAHLGLQVILLEYDNTDKIKYTTTNTNFDRTYEGPSFKLYATSPPGIPWGAATVPWPSGDFAVPKLTGLFPALRDHVLFDKQNAFLGGMPPVQAKEGYPNTVAYGNGFRGIIYEVMMLEGVLSPGDKQRLQKILQRKYPLQ